jgi:phosphoribosylformylglycinamidine synthase subunit PurQ / glutaminase
VTLRVAGSRAIFFRGLERLYLPIAHAEGRIVARNPRFLAELDRDGQIALRYAAPDGSTLTGGELLPFPFNPNGAADNIAGLCDATGRVCGLMPHPERHIDPTQHPQWTRRRTQPPDGEGLAVFRNAVEYFR